MPRTHDTLYSFNIQAKLLETTRKAAGYDQRSIASFVRCAIEERIARMYPSLWQDLRKERRDANQPEEE